MGGHLLLDVGLFDLLAVLGAVLRRVLNGVLNGVLDGVLDGVFGCHQRRVVAVPGTEMRRRVGLGRLERLQVDAAGVRQDPQTAPEAILVHETTHKRS